MVKLRHALRWYLYGLFPQPYTSIAVVLFLILQFITLKVLTDSQNFFTLLQILLIPLVVLSNGLHFFRNQNVTVFEINLLRKWTLIPLSKIIMMLFSFAPYMIGESIFLYLMGFEAYIPLVAINFVVYSGLLLAFSLLPSSTSSIAMSFVFTFLLPIASSALIENYVNLGISSGPIMGAFIYVFSPIFGYHFYTLGKVSVNLLDGLIVDLVLSVLLMILYIFGFMRSQVKP